MKIVTWNINGIRSLKQNIKEILKELDGDIVCFQETKISRSQLPEDTALVDGYSSYFNFPKWQSGYSGVATYCRDFCAPTKAEDGLSRNLNSYDESSCIGNRDSFSDALQGFSFDLSALDNEGRVIITQHELKNGNNTEKLAVINVYCPRVDCEKPERRVYKMQFCQLLEARSKSLVEEGFHVVIVGDMNIAHQPIDHCDPGDEKDFKAHEGRSWLTLFLDSEISKKWSTSGKDPLSLSFVDTFRFLHPDKKEAYTCWNTLTGARQTNYGTRIDYILSSKKILPFITSCEILSNVFGSDHCPVRARLDCVPLPSSKLPSLCCHFWPEFSGKQQKLLTFLKKSNSTGLNDEGINKRKPDQNHSLQKEKKNKKSNGIPKQKAITSFLVNNRLTKTDKFSDNELPETVSTNKKEELLTEIPAQNDCEKFDDKQFEGSLEENQIRSALTKAQSEMWKNVLSGPPPPPLCKGHGKACVLRTVKKEGPNYGRQFFTCPQPNGHPSNPESRCDFFKWATAAKISVLKKK